MPQDFKLELFIMPQCPYCRKVLRFMQEHNLQSRVSLKDIISNPQDREVLEALTDNTQVPCLVINGKPMLESDDIIAWMKENLIK